MADIIKRLFDIAFALVGLLISWPLLVAIATLVRLTSPGPILYRGWRTGRFGQPFQILKFRTMIADAEQRGGTTTGKNDVRLTSVGRLLRRSKLDELPQLVNVLRGEMSVVGPRPEVSEYTDEYSQEERRILDVRPGITDWACLEFNDLQEWVGEEDPDRTYRETILPRKNALRLRYATEHTLWIDATILARTVRLMLGKWLRGRLYSSAPSNHGDLTDARARHSSAPSAWGSRA